MNDKPADSGGLIPSRHDWIVYGLIGGIVMAGLTMMRLVVVKSRRIAAEMGGVVKKPPSVSWTEIVRLTALVFAMGFACGVIVRMLRRLSIRFGAVGDILIGILVLNAFFLMCILAFDPVILTRPWRVVSPLFAMATFLGVIGGFFGGRSIRKEILGARDET